MDTNRTQMLNQDPNRTQLGSPATSDPNKTMMGSPLSLNVTQTIKPVQCPICKTFNPIGVMFCVDCGLIFERALPPDAFGAPAVQLPKFVEASGREHFVRPGSQAAGREGEIELNDGKVSRRHAQISNESGVVSVEDLGSTNGTFVNDIRLNPNDKIALNAGDRVSFGGVVLQFALPGAAGGNTTQVFSSNKTAAIAAPPKVEAAPGRLVGSGFDLPLKKGNNSFGRKPENDVQIADPYVSGQHGIIELSTDGIYVTDTGSTNGTLLGDSKLVANMRTLVRDNEPIRLGSLELLVILDGEA